MRVAWAALIAVGCTASGKDVVEKHRQVVEGQVSRLMALAPDAAKRQRLTVDDLGRATSLTLEFGTEGDFNAAVVYPGYLEDPCEGKKIYWIGEDGKLDSRSQVHAAPHDMVAAWLTGPACVLRTGTWHGGTMEKETAERMLRELPKVEYVLVPRLEFRLPIHRYEPGAEVQRFRAGAVTGDALIYELATGAYLGGFTVSATNDDEVWDESTSSLTSLQDNLLRNARSAIHQKVKKLAPGWRPPV